MVEEERGGERERERDGRREERVWTVFCLFFLFYLFFLFNFFLPKFCTLSSSWNTPLTSSPFSIGCFSSPWLSQHLSWCYICYVQLLRVTLLMDYVKQGGHFLFTVIFPPLLIQLRQMFFLYKRNNSWVPRV